MTGITNYLRKQQKSYEMKTNNRVAAFTVMEMTIAMLISAIVIAFTYSAFGILKRAYAEFSKKNKQRAELLQLDHVLKRDFFKSISIYRTESGLRFADTSVTIEYIIDSEAIIRKGISTDTFKIGISNVSILFGQLPVVSNTDSLEKTEVDEFAFSGTTGHEIIPFHYYKIYSSQNLIRRFE